MRAHRSLGRALKVVKLNAAKFARPSLAGAVSDGDTQPHSLVFGQAERILHYEIQSKLGEGGMGIVYKAVDQKLNRFVALKFLPPQIDASGVHFQRFLQEATALSALNHPNIATIYAVETAGDRQFLSIELLPGGTLKAKLQHTYARGGTLPFEDILKYAQQTAEGLAHAHARGIIHRDVKTSNLLLTEEGDVKITDFGVAKLGGTSLSTVPGSLLGTISYMSPEQAMGLDVDERTDQFSFGVVLFELISGRLPFEAGNDAALLTKVANARVPELKAFRADLPPKLEEIVGRALKKRVEERYPTMAELLLDIRSARGNRVDCTREMTQHPAPSLAPSIPTRWRRGAAVAIAAAMLAIIVFGGVRQLVSRWSTQQQTPTQAPREKNSIETIPNRLGVLPFRSLVQDPDVKAFAQALTGELAQRLSQFKQFQGSLSVASVTPAPGERVPATEGDLTLFLTGNVIERQGSIVVTVDLVDARKKTVLNSIDIETPSDRRASIHESLANKVAEILHTQIAEAPGVDELYLRGRGYLDRYDRIENLENAIRSFDKALSTDSNYALALAGRAEAYLRKYRLTRDETSLSLAHESVTAAMQSNSQMAPVHFAMGLYQVATGNQTGAIESFERSQSIEPTADATRELANAYDATNRLELAESTYRQAIELRKGRWLGYKDLAVFYQNHGRLKEAFPLFRLVVQLVPDDHSSYTNLGGVYLKLQMYPEAIEILQKAVEIDPDPLAYHNLGTGLYLDHRYREAIDAFREATKRNPTEGTHWGALGDAYRMVPGMVDSAIGAYEQAILLKERELKIRPSDASLRAQIASWHTLTNRRRALSEIRQAIRLSPKDARVHACAATVFEQLHLRDQAIAAVEKALKLGYSVSELQNWPPLERLRLDPRYKNIIAKATEGGTVPISHN